MKNDWPVKKLGEITSYFNDGNWIESDDQSSKGIRLIQTGNVGLGFFKEKDDKARYVSEETFKKLKCTEIFEGDILISRLPDPVGRACILPKLNERAITAVDCTIVRFDDRLQAKYFQYYAMTKLYFNEIEKYHTGSSRVRISRSNLAKINVLIPPVGLQKQIVRKLDSIRKALELIDLQIQKTEELFESIIQKEIINKNQLWNQKQIRNIAVMVGSGSTPRGGSAVYKKQGIYFIRSQNVLMLNLDFSDIVFIDDKVNERMKRTKVFPNDILLNITGASIGRVAIFPGNYKTANVNQHVCIIRLNTEVLPKYFAIYLSTKLGQEQIWRLQAGGTRQGLNFEQVKDVKISFPNLEIQQQIVEKIDAIQEYKNLLKKEKQLYKELFDSVLDKSIKGEMV